MQLLLCPRHPRGTFFNPARVDYHTAIQLGALPRKSHFQRRHRGIATPALLLFTPWHSYASAFLGVVILSVRPSVTRVLGDKTNNALRIFWYHTRGLSF